MRLFKCLVGRKLIIVIDLFVTCRWFVVIEKIITKAQCSQWISSLCVILVDHATKIKLLFLEPDLDNERTWATLNSH